MLISNYMLPAAAVRQDSFNFKLNEVASKLVTNLSILLAWALRLGQLRLGRLLQPTRLLTPHPAALHLLRHQCRASRWLAPNSWLGRKCANMLIDYRKTNGFMSCLQITKQSTMLVPGNMVALLFTHEITGEIVPCSSDLSISKLESAIDLYGLLCV